MLLEGFTERSDSVFLWAHRRQPVHKMQSPLFRQTRRIYARHRCSFLCRMYVCQVELLKGRRENRRVTCRGKHGCLFALRFLIPDGFTERFDSVFLWAMLRSLCSRMVLLEGFDGFTERSDSVGSSQRQPVQKMPSPCSNSAHLRSASYACANVCVPGRAAPNKARESASNAAGETRRLCSSMNDGNQRGKVCIFISLYLL